MRIKNFAKTDLSRTVIEINVFFHFAQKFKMTAKNVEKIIFWDTMPMDTAATLQAKIFIKNTHLAP